MVGGKAMQINSANPNVIQLSGNSVRASPPTKTMQMFGQGQTGQVQVLEAGVQPQVLQIGNQVHVVGPERRLVKVDAAGGKNIILQTAPASTNQNLGVSFALNASSMLCD